MYGDDVDTVFALRVVQTTIRWDLLPDPYSPDSIATFIDGTKKWLNGATYRQVLAALSWVLNGNKEIIRELDDEEDKESEDDDETSIHIGLVHQGQALSLGTLDDLCSMTTSSLLATI